MSDLAVAVETLLEVTEYGEELRLEQVWEAIDAMVSRGELKEAVAAVTGMVPPPDADADGQMRALPPGYRQNPVPILLAGPFATSSRRRSR